jgi:2-methylcitrate dehydratase PrpD
VAAESRAFARVTDSPTLRLAEFMAGLDAESIPAHVLHQAARLLLDTSCCAVSGYLLDNGRKLVRVLERAGGAAEATILSTGLSVPAAAAAMANTQLANGLDLDDNLLYHSHFANCCVLPGLAIAEREHASGLELLVAIVGAFEVTARLALSMPALLRPIKPPPGARFEWRNPYGHSYNVFGAAAGAGRLLKLSPEKMASAFGIAGYTAPVPTIDKAFSGARFTDMKYTAYGWMAWSGVMAAELAREGMTGDDRVLDGDHGFWRMMAAESCDFEMLTRELGTKWWILDTSIKPYPAGTWMRNSMRALDRIMRRPEYDVTKVDRIVVRTWLLREDSPATQSSPRSYLDTQVSYPYLLAVSALGISPSRWHTPEVYESQRVLSTMKKIEFVHDPKSADVIYEEMLRWHGRTTKAPATVEVHQTDALLIDSAEYGKGDPFDESTTLTDDDLVEKFRLFCSDVIQADRVEGAAEALLGIADAPDVASVVRSLRD